MRSFASVGAIKRRWALDLAIDRSNRMAPNCLLICITLSLFFFLLPSYFFLLHATIPSSFLFSFPLCALTPDQNTPPTPSSLIWEEEKKRRRENKKKMKKIRKDKKKMKKRREDLIFFFSLLGLGFRNFLCC